MGEKIILSDLFHIFEDRTSKRFKYFRGQVRDWSLRPSLARESVTEQERTKESECFERLAEILPEVNDWERATIAQHYGIPTRLLDWSENPLVGLYFALYDNNYDDNNCDKEDSVIWVFEDKTMLKPEVASFRDNSGKPKLKYPRPYPAWRAMQYKIPRTEVQCGALTSQPDLSKEFDKQNFDQNTQSLKKFIVPKEAKKQLREQLKILGVTEDRLFPDYLDIGNRRPTDLVGACMRIRCELFKTG